MLNEDVVKIAGFAVYRHSCLCPLQTEGPIEGCELAPLAGIHDFWRPKLVDGLVPRREAELRLQRVRYPPRQHLAREPVHDGHQIEVAFTNGQVIDIGAPDLIGSVDPQPAQQIGVGLEPLRGLARVGFLDIGVDLIPANWTAQN